jgi:hypothetical protein
MASLFYDERCKTTASVQTPYIEQPLTTRPLDYSASEPTQMVSVEMMCTSIDSELERLVRQLTELTQRLDPILLPDGQEGIERDAYGQANCRLGQVLYSHLSAIVHANRMLSNTITRILL